MWLTLRFQECISMKRVNSKVYTDAEWKLNQIGILVVSVGLMLTCRTLLGRAVCGKWA